MNVKPGDIARVVGIRPPLQENNQRIVHVDEACTCDGGGFYSTGVWRCTTLQSMTAFGGRGRVQDLSAGASVCIHDRHLRPLHDGDGVDEVIRYAGKPQETWVESLEAARVTP